LHRHVWHRLLLRIILAIVGRAGIVGRREEIGLWIIDIDRTLLPSIRRLWRRWLWRDCFFWIEEGFFVIRKCLK